MIYSPGWRISADTWCAATVSVYKLQSHVETTHGTKTHKTSTLRAVSNEHTHQTKKKMSGIEAKKNVTLSRNVTQFSQKNPDFESF